MIDIQWKPVDPLLDVVWDGYQTNSSVDKAVAPNLAMAGDIVEKLCHLRYDFAVSGAMRWYWSQEAPIHLKAKLIY